ncbi:MAG: right-handed parallel beta-helix repeat-containing protein [Planctomycetota bacterium]|jgi:hypothetical protein
MIWYPLDSVHVWHVSPSGNNANSGHAAANPIDLVNDAKLTIANAMAAAVSGDTIVIHPGSYDENIDANAANKSLWFHGMDMNACKIAPATGVALKLEANSIVTNLSLEALDAAAEQGKALVPGASNTKIYGCDLYGAWDAIEGSCDNLVVEDCRLRSKYDVVTLSASKNVRFTNCMMHALGTYGTTTPNRAMSCNLSGTFDHCQFIAERSDVSAQALGAVTLVASNSYVVFNDCLFQVTGGANHTGQLYGIATVGALTTLGAKVTNCQFSVTTSGSPSAGPYHIWAIKGIVNTSGCGLDTSLLYENGGTIVSEEKRLEEIHAKIPSKDYLMGSADADGGFDAEAKADVNAQALAAANTYDAVKRSEATSDKNQIISQVDAAESWVLLNGVKINSVQSTANAVNAVTGNLPNSGALTDIDTGVNDIETKLDAAIVTLASVTTTKNLTHDSTVVIRNEDG